MRGRPLWLAGTHPKGESGCGLVAVSGCLFSAWEEVPSVCEAMRGRPARLHRVSVLSDREAISLRLEIRSDAADATRRFGGGFRPKNESDAQRQNRASQLGKTQKDICGFNRDYSELAFGGLT